MLGHLAGDQVIVVIAGNGDKHIGPSRAGLSQCGYLTAITPHTNATQLVADKFGPLGAFFQHLQLSKQESPCRVGENENPQRNIKNTKTVLVSISDK